MDLSTLVDQHLESGFGFDLGAGGKSIERLHAALEERTAFEERAAVDGERRTAAFAASLFWQSFIGSKRFAETLRSVGLSPPTLEQTDAFVVAHGGGWRYDLILFDEGLGPETILARPVDAPPDDLRQGWYNFWEDRRPGWTENEQPLFAVDYASELALEAARIQHYGIVVVGYPERLLTSVPTSPWTVISQNTGAGAPAGTESAGICTAGVKVQNGVGQVGVTAAYHAAGAPGTDVTVEGRAGSVRSADAVTDSSFIEIWQDVPPGSLRRTEGPLSGVTPRGYEPVTFWGIRSAKVDTQVIGWSPELPLVIRGSQLKVLTKPVTQPGDSGAALLDGEDHVLGFAFYRTGFGAPAEFAAWIWAESVYMAHNLVDVP